MRCSVENEERGLRKTRSVECGERGLQCVLNTGVWKMRSVLATKCRHSGVCLLVGNDKIK